MCVPLLFLSLSSSPSPLLSSRGLIDGPKLCQIGLKQEKCVTFNINFQYILLRKSQIFPVWSQSAPIWCQFWHPPLHLLSKASWARLPAPSNWWTFDFIELYSNSRVVTELLVESSLLQLWNYHIFVPTLYLCNVYYCCWYICIVCYFLGQSNTNISIRLYVNTKCKH